MSPVRSATHTKISLEDEIETIKDIVQDCNISFLIGSGLSSPFFGTLGNIEIWLEELEKKRIDKNLKSFIKASLYKCYFDIAMKNNQLLHKYTGSKDYYYKTATKTTSKLNNTYKAYKDFLKTFNEILYERRSNTVNKQVNLFTTNIDIFLEKVIDDLDLQFNDGFNGVFNKRYSLSNFKKSYYQKSLHYDNISEMPVFNILKLHGSLTWELKNQNIYFSDLTILKEVSASFKGIPFLDIKQLNDDYWDVQGINVPIDEIITEAKKIATLPDVTSFNTAYEKLQVINPTKEKFKDTTFNKTYYEMLRLYSNELEKENSVLFVMGFSMADEHIRDITFRAVKSNPTLKVYIISYNKDAKDILENLKKDDRHIENSLNIELIAPEDNFNLRKMNKKLFFPLLEEIKLSKK